MQSPMGPSVEIFLWYRPWEICNHGIRTRTLHPILPLPWCCAHSLLAVGAIDFLHRVPRGPDPKAYLLPSRTSCSPRMFFPVPLSERNSLAIALALWRSWTWLSDGRAVTSLDGHQALRALRSFMCSHSLTASACPPDEPKPCLTVSILSLQARAFLFLPWAVP